MHVLATAGHVDHGKSTLVRALTGMEPDRWAEERRRGMTIDLGFAWTTLDPGGSVAFVDVPGHERFVTTMLAGVGPVPAVLLVVAADEGWMPQSGEHLDALAALGVHHGLLVITRSDLMEPELALSDSRDHLADTPLEGVPAVSVSATTGAGMDELRAALGDLTAALPDPDTGADVRLWVDRAFTIRGAGTVVTGTLGAGRLRVDDELELVTPDGTRPVGVRALQSLGRTVQEARGVSRVAVNLRGVPLEAVSRGDVLLSPGAWLTTDVVDVRLHGPRGTAPDPADLPAELSLHVGAAAVSARVRPLGADTVRLRLRHPVPFRIGDRAVLRDPGRRQVSAGLTVLDVRPPALTRRGAAARRAEILAGVDGLPSAVDELARRGIVRRADLVAMGVADLGPVAVAPAAAGWLVDPQRATALVADLAAAVAAHDAADPLDPGLPVEAARRAVGLPEARLVDALLRHADRTGANPGLVLRDGRVLHSAAAGLPAPVRAAMDALRADLERDPFAAPDAARLAELGLGPRQLASLVKAGELLRVADGVVLLAGADDRALDVLAGLGPEFTLSTARQALGTSRRVAVPLLELLARTGRTARTPDGGHRIA
ncbi:selenocysteine-specific translation elongation factor [Pseudonocardia sp.]|jgi:selenocysteine-specific elongation factor|uniref:selenocysteine-specific translation elongation factor n=1 Tax=Pseudonocardia sp. TaxID=60912 RepID=UPI00260F6346|nr:selenocysteine-specific translation elongation factor [Pseudonocardia sp.]MCW2716619.1 selenocysteine-specific translation elongation factor [Pseudonocardia sp.]MDT7615907.1 selenocysteine-specific elongation factor [Pseudonocardiales bacterium]